MGYAVRADPDALVGGASRLVVAAQTLDAVAGRVVALCAAAGSAVAGTELALALEETGRETARAVAGAAGGLTDLGTGTQLAAEGYLRVERAPEGDPDVGAR
ncbi:hypothetical protein [Ornithinimicrobium pekingense]|uniref:Uncharacterized protein n=1 Tax=Ornithinimicrobium pekingense TaxID=384677 RepID=A0ABQ2F5Q7_9MICO|nr:hypothetical protein [Ornithinimicrobium pekingense]GGK62346.1 hypothetical protein GCM10011509_08450 [Ornithinimicrobium pekingense]